MVPAMATWFIGDVHGCSSELADLLGRIAPTRSDRLILAGDLFDKGPDPAGVLRLFREMGAEAVLGNHDVAIREHGRARLAGRDDPAAKGYVARCLDQLDSAGMLAEAVELCAGLPLLRRGEGWIAVHGGLHPTGGPDATDERLATTLRAFPPGDPAARRWWRQWAGAELVIFGHDARQGLVDHREAGRPRAIGLDTGCVYGGQLTAWCLEADRFVQVQARQVWHAKG